MTHEEIIQEVRRRCKNLNPRRWTYDVYEDSIDSERLLNEDDSPFVDAQFAKTSEAFWVWSENFVYFLLYVNPRFSDEMTYYMDSVPLHPGTNDLPRYLVEET